MWESQDYSCKAETRSPALLCAVTPMPVLVLALGVILGRIPGGTKHEQGMDGIYPALLKVVLWDQGLCKFTQECC